MLLPNPLRLKSLKSIVCPIMNKAFGRLLLLKERSFWRRISVFDVRRRFLFHKVKTNTRNDPKLGFDPEKVLNNKDQKRVIEFTGLLTNHKFLEFMSQ